MNAEFQRIARRDKKAFLSDQCKEIEENNRMGKTRDLKKIRDTKGTFPAKMGTIKVLGFSKNWFKDIKYRCMWPTLWSTRGYRYGIIVAVEHSSPYGKLAPDEPLG